MKKISGNTHDNRQVQNNKKGWPIGLRNLFRSNILRRPASNNAVVTLGVLA